MEIFEIKKEVSSFSLKLKNIKTNVSYLKLKEDCLIIKKKMNEEDFWNDHKKSSSYSKELKQKSDLVNKIEEIDKLIEDITFLINDMPMEKEEILNTFNLIASKVSSLEIESLLSEEHDDGECILEIHPGAGGVESHDFALMLFNMYEKYLQKEEIKYQVLEFNKGEVAGVKSVSIKIMDFNSFGMFKRESGVHRLIRLSPFDSDNRRHTSFASVKISPLLEEVDFELDEKDLKIDTYRSSGAGGQSVNTTDSAVRVTHIPSGIVITCQNERSQIQNKEQALRVLKSKLIVLEEEAKKEKASSLLGEVKSNSFGSQKRTYTLHPYKLVKDHVSSYESSKAEKVLQGYIKEFLYANLTTKN